MYSLIDDDEIFPKKLINREKELQLIKTAFNDLLAKDSALNTPIIDFFGVDGIGKTTILQEISATCIANDLPCIKLDESQTQLVGSQSTSKISRAILQQARKYQKQFQKQPPTRKGDPHSQTVEAIKVLLESTPVVILLDSIDASNEALMSWLKGILRNLIRHNNLFVVLTSKQKIVFEKDWSMARKLTPFQLKPLNRDDSMSYLQSIDDTISPKNREIIFQWTRGYPLAMEVMIKTIIKRHFDLEKNEDQQHLITIIIEETIDKKVLAHVEPSQLDWYKAHLFLLCIPRRFNLIIMQELLETFGSPLIGKRESKLEYMSLPKRLNANAEILYWDMQKAGFTVDDSIRRIFFFHQRIHHFALFIKIHRYLAEKNMQIAIEVASSDSIRYFCEYLYHSAQSLDAKAMKPILQSTLEQINKISSNLLLQFQQEFTRDKELQEILGEHSEIVYAFVGDHLTSEE
jgi:hypothetical protein